MATIGSDSVRFCALAVFASSTVLILFHGLCHGDVCGDELIDEGTKCLRFINFPDGISGNDARIHCLKYKQNLVTLAAMDEWHRFKRVVHDLNITDYTYVGVQLVSRFQGTTMKSIYDVVPVWADFRTAFNLNISHIVLFTIDFYPYCFIYDLSGIRTEVEPVSCGYKDIYWVVCETLKHVGHNTTTAALLEQSSMDVDVKSAYIKIKPVQCPLGHVTSDYMSCDAKSQCGASEHMTSCKMANTKLPMFSCEESRQTVHYTVLCDHVLHCMDGTDEDFCEYPVCPAGLVTCLSGQCIQGRELCDGIAHCADGSDEECKAKFSVSWKAVPPPAKIVPGDTFYDDFSKTKLLRMFGMESMNEWESCPATHFRCPEGYCLPIYLRCNGVDDCSGREDEFACDSYTCPGYYRCRDSTVCLHPDHMCDGVFHCPQQDDEQLCEKLTCPVVCHCQGLAFLCTANFSASSYPALRYLDASGSGLTPEDLVKNLFLVGLRLSSNGLKNFKFPYLPNLKTLDLSWNNISLMNMQSVRFLKNLRFLSLSGNPLATVSNTFLSNTHLFTFALWHDHLFKTIDTEINVTATLNLQTLDLTYTGLKEYSEKTFACAPHLKNLNMSNSKLQNIRDGGFKSTPKLQSLDMKNCQLNTFPLNLLKQLTALTFVKADNFIICCKTLLPEGFKSVNCHSDQDLLASCEDLIKSNMYRVSLWSFALLSIMGNAGSFAARLYFHHNRSMQDSFRVFVINLSLADFLMGVYLIIIGVADQAYQGSYLRNDNLWKRSVICKIAGFLSLISNQVSAFIICFITVDRFLSLCPLCIRLQFRQRSALVACGIAWLAGIALSAVSFLLPPPHWHIHTTSICIPLPFASRNEQSQDHFHFFGVTIMLNFILFLVVAFLQMLIYWFVQAHYLGSSWSLMSGSKNVTTARRVMTIVLSNFLCWFCIGIMPLLVSRGSHIPDHVNVGVAVLLLPLNSALNPYLYAFSVFLEKRQKVQEACLLKRLERQFQRHRSDRKDPAMEVTTVSVQDAVDQVQMWLNERVLVMEDIYTLASSSSKPTCEYKS